MKDGVWVGSVVGEKGEALSHAVETMITKLALPGSQKLYNRRGVLVEPANAYLKDRRGLRPFARRGRDAERRSPLRSPDDEPDETLSAGLTAAPATSWNGPQDPRNTAPRPLSTLNDLRRGRCS